MGGEGIDKVKPLFPNNQIPPYGQGGQSKPIHVDLKNAVPKVCNNILKFTDKDGNVGARECGCDIFIPAVKLFTVSALVSPTGQELLAQQPVLVCKECGRVVTT